MNLEFSLDKWGLVEVRSSSFYWSLCVYLAHRVREAELIKFVLCDFAVGILVSSGEGLDGQTLNLLSAGRADLLVHLGAPSDQSPHEDSHLVHSNVAGTVEVVQRVDEVDLLVGVHGAVGVWVGGCVGGLG